MRFLGGLNFPSGFMLNGNCNRWFPSLVAVQPVSDSLRALFTLAIPAALLCFIRERRDFPFRRMFLCFAGGIVANGAMRRMEIWTIWFPTYWIAGTLKVVTAYFSRATAMRLSRVTSAGLSGAQGMSEMNRKTS